MDIVIPFKRSINNDEELRMALRTMERNLFGAEHVWVIGDQPRWATSPTNLTVIPFPDIYREDHFRDRNMVNKLLKACQVSAIPDEFLVAHDDNFITSPCDIDIWPWYQKGNIWNGQGVYSLTESNTKELFSERTPNFDLHCPHIMTKEGIINSLKPLDWSKPGGYCIKTVYCVVNALWSEFYTDLKINYEAPLEDVERKVTAGRRFFSCGDRAFKPGVQQWLLARFPNKSKYEL